MELSKTNTVGTPEMKSQSLVFTAQKSFLDRYQWKLYVVALVISDLFMVAAAFRVAYFIRFEMQIPIFKLAFAPSLTFYLYFVAALTPIWIVIHAVVGLYNRSNLLGG